MDNETVNQETTQNTPEQADRTFTQAEVDTIIGERLKREREKYADYPDLRTKAGAYDDLVKRHAEATTEIETLKGKVQEMTRAIESRNARDKVSADTGVPANLLTGNTVEECEEQAKRILAWRGPTPSYPTLPDGGEVSKVAPGTTRQQFATWFETNVKK